MWFIWANFSPDPRQELCPNHDFPAVIFARSPRLACSLALAWEDVEQACSAHEGGRGGDSSCKPSFSPTSACPAWRGPRTPTPAKLLQPRTARSSSPLGARISCNSFWEVFLASSSPLLGKSNTHSVLFAEMNVQIKPEGEGLRRLPPRLAWLLPAP